MRSSFQVAVVVAAFGIATLLVACSRENRILRQPPPADQTINTVQVSGLNPGANSIPTPPSSNLYQESAYAVSEGQKLYEQFNCSGCHFHGGGGIGPPLMDEEWIYGSSPAQIYTSIAEGRPNGMPSWGGHIPDYQIWQLVTYVRSVGGFEGRVAAASRSEGMQAKKAEEPAP